MKKLIRILPVLLGLIGSVGNSSDGNTNPSLNSKCPFTAATPLNGGGVIYDESCTMAYVLPPKTGTVAIDSLSPTTNIQFCPSIKNVNQVATRTFDSIDVVSQKIQDMIKSYDPLDKELLEMKVKLGIAKSKMEIAKKQLENAELQLQDLRHTTRDARIAYENCMEAAGNASCLELKSTWDKAKDSLNSFHKDHYRKKLAGAENATEDHNLLLARMNILNSRYMDALSPMLEMQERLASLGHRVMELYQDYVMLEGASGQIIWTVNWDRSLEDYRKANPDLRVNWTRLPLKDVEFIATLKTGNNPSNTGITAVKSAFFPGARPTGFAGMGKGEKVNALQTEASNTHSSPIFGNSLSGQVVLTLAGACPYFSGIEERTSLNVDDLASTMIANLIYTYELATKRSYTATYNLSALVRRIEQKIQKGGFFATTAAHNIIDDGDSSDWFSIDFGANSSSFQYSSQEQKEIKTEIKKELMDKTIRQMAILNAGSAVAPVLPQSIDSGAATARKELRECVHYYCQAASAIVGVADSIWGRSNSTASFHKNNNSWSTERINGTQFIDYSGSITFARD
jgi:hypothetical protein